MAVSKQHCEYPKWAQQAFRNRLIFEGEQSLKCFNTYGLASQQSLQRADSETLTHWYHPIIRRLSGQTAWEFEAYQDRAVLYPFGKRVRQAFNGAIFRKDPVINLPASLEYLRDEATPYATSLVQLMSTTADEVVSVGRYGILVDVPAGQQEPVFLPYCGEKIINWRIGDVNGKQDIVLVVLQECIITPNPQDEFDEIEIEQYRVLRMVDGGNGVQIYVQEVWQDDELVSQTIPTAAGKPLGYIPFVFFNTSNNQPNPEYSILYDLLTLNLHHYRWTAEEGNGLHFVALPTAWVSGTKIAGQATVAPFIEKPSPPSLPVTDPSYQAREQLRLDIANENKFNRQQQQQKTFHLGPSHLLDLGPTGAQAGILEHTGEGIKSIQEKMNTLVTQMAAIGARLFAEQPQDETATAVKVQKTSESNALMHICNVLDEGFTDLLNYAAAWLGGGEATVAVNREFVESPMTPTEATALYNLFKAGGVDCTTLMYQYAKGGVYSDDIDLQVEQARLEDAKAQADAAAQAALNKPAIKPGA